MVWGLARNPGRIPPPIHPDMGGFVEIAGLAIAQVSPHSRFARPQRLETPSPGYGWRKGSSGIGAEARSRGYQCPPNRRGDRFQSSPSSGRTVPTAKTSDQVVRVDQGMWVHGDPSITLDAESATPEAARSSNHADPGRAAGSRPRRVVPARLTFPGGRRKARPQLAKGGRIGGQR